METAKVHPYITIDAKRWFQKTNGNTYHSVNVYVNNVLIGRCDFTYGYGEQYLVTALKLLNKAGVFQETSERLASGIGKDYVDFMRDMQDNRAFYHITVNDVTRKKDL